MRVKLRENVVHLWIILPAENDNLAWSGSQWVPVDRDGLSAGEIKIASFASAKDAAAYAESAGFEVEHG